MTAHSLLEKDELLAIKRLITLLHADMHNPGAAAHIAEHNGTPEALDRETDEIIYLIDHAIENAH